MGIIAGAMAGAGEAGVQAGLQYQRHAGEMDLQKAREEAAMARETTLQLMRQEHDKSMVDVRANSEIDVSQRKIDLKTDPANVEKEAAAAIKLSELTLPAEVKRKTDLAAVDTARAVEEFKKLAPLKRQEVIDAEMAKLKALSSPEALTAARKVALATRIVDPNYQMIPLEGGQVALYDARTGKSSGVLSGPDGKPIVRRDPSELQAALGILNMTNTELKIAQADHKAMLADAMGDKAAVERANSEFKAKSDELKMRAAPALAVLMGKAGAKTDKPGEPTAAPAGPRRPLEAFDAGAPKTSTPKAAQNAPANSAAPAGGTFSGELDMTAPAGGIIAGKIPPRAPVIAPAQTTESIAKDQGRDLNKWR